MCFLTDIGRGSCLVENIRVTGWIVTHYHNTQVRPSVSSSDPLVHIRTDFITDLTRQLPARDHHCIRSEKKGAMGLLSTQVLVNAEINDYSYKNVVVWYKAKRLCTNKFTNTEQTNILQILISQNHFLFNDVLFKSTKNVETIQ